MTHTEALKLALEAADGLKDVTRRVNELIAENKALKAALAQQNDHSEQHLDMVKAQPAQQEPVACVQDLGEVKRKHLVYEKGMDWKDPLYTTPQPAPVQEPVAWMDIDEKGSASGLRYWSEPDNRHEVALYTTPPQRTWVGLTDREKSNLWLESRAAIPRFHTYATLAEAKLKEKNNGLL